MTARPQLENGHLRVANELMEAIARTRIPGEARQVFDVIIRKTYGFNKKNDRISLSQFCLATGIKKPRVCRAILKLIAMNLIIKKGNGTCCSYAINKDFDEWNPLPKKITLPKKGTSVTQKGNNRSPKRDIQKTKDTITKDTPSFSPDSVEFKLSTRLLSRIKSRHPHLTRKPVNLQTWSRDIDLLIRIDKAPAAEIGQVIDFISRDHGNGNGSWHGWGGVIQSASGLRKNYPKIVSAMPTPTASAAVDIKGNTLLEIGSEEFIGGQA